MSTTPAHSTIIREGVLRIIGDSIAGGRPGRIESYDASKQRATVQPLVMAGSIDPSTGERVLEAEPVLNDVPVLMLGTARARVTMDIRPGDTVWILSAQYAMGQYLIQGGQVDPGDDRRHFMSDAVCLPAVFDFAGVPGDASTDGEIVHAAKLRLGGPGSSQRSVRGDAYRSAEDTLFTALVTAFHAIKLYAVAIQGTADPSNAATPALVTALTTTLDTAKAAFDAAASSYLASNVMVP